MSAKCQPSSQTQHGNVKTRVPQAAVLHARLSRFFPRHDCYCNCVVELFGCWIDLQSARVELYLGGVFKNSTSRTIRKTAQTFDSTSPLPKIRQSTMPLQRFHRGSCAVGPRRDIVNNASTQRVVNNSSSVVRRRLDWPRSSGELAGNKPNAEGRVVLIKQLRPEPKHDAACWTK